jgi:predicted O-linked N-acetylglucosamine transferase (SPINDLY family)
MENACETKRDTNAMNALLQDALQKYKSGDFHGLLKRHGPSVGKAGCPQILLVLVAQSHLKTGNELKAAEHYRKAGEAAGDNHLNYLLIAGNLFMRNAMMEQAYHVGREAIGMALRDPQALEFYHRALLETCLFGEIEQAQAMLRARLEQGDTLAFRSDNPFGNVTWCADEAINGRIVSSAVTRSVTPAMQQERRRRPHAWGGKLRIGYLSDDYYENHPMMRLFQGVMVSHDPARFDVTHFCFTSAKNIAADTMRKHYPNLVQIGHLNDEQAADFIRSQQIDILVDLKGHTNGARPNLVNLGLAPIQAAHHGFPGSANGVDCDYVISDRIITPDTSRPYYHEKLCRLPASYQPNDNIFRARPAAMPDRTAFGLPADRIVLGFFNATRKLTPSTFRLIVDCLRACENAVLWILLLNDFARDNFLAAIGREGIDSARIILAPKAKYEQHIARLAAIDIALDSFPYNGHTTTSDLLWAGVPVPTWRGTHFASRVSESLLTALGVPELVADGPEDYVALVRELATNADKRLALRAKIATNRDTAPLFDTARFTRHLEHAFEMMAERARQGLQPDHIDVPPLDNRLQ